MNINEPTLTIPLRAAESRTITIGNTRVTLDTFINYYLQGESPEELHEGFPTIPLPAIYAVIAYYLAHRADVDAYLQTRIAEAERIQQEVEARFPPKITRAELQARVDARQGRPDND